jgi:hypothetical protein
VVVEMHLAPIERACDAAAQARPVALEGSRFDAAALLHPRQCLMVRPDSLQGSLPNHASRD